MCFASIGKYFMGCISDIRLRLNFWHYAKNAVNAEYALPRLNRGRYAVVDFIKSGIRYYRENKMDLAALIISVIALVVAILAATKS